VIVGGSPCQDLSLAGKRKGLSGERSGLFMEQIRIIREMREKDGSAGRSGFMVRPRFGIWENVPGAFSSNGGADFQSVLTEFVRIAEPDAPDVPLPDNGRWPKSGTLYQKMGGWSVAWRVHDAQYWGVPQRRKRICVLADFGGLAAPEILFDPQLRRTTEDGDPIAPDRYSGTERRPEIQTQPESLSGDSSESGAQRKGTAAVVGSGPAYSIQGNTVDRAAKQNGLGISEDVAHTLNAVDRHAVCYPDTVNTLPARMDGSPCIDRGPPVIAVYDARDNGDGMTCPTLTGDHQNRVTDYTALAIPINTMVGTRDSAEMRTCLGIGEDVDPQFTISAAHSHAVCIQTYSLQRSDEHKESDKSHTLSARDYKDATDLIVYAPDVSHALRAKANLQCREDGETYIVAAVDCRNGTANPDINGTLQAKEQCFNTNSNNVVLIWPEVRRLTPLECTRLQGYPDGWLDIGDWTDESGKLHREADAPKYKAAGNSIALPFWSWLARRICAEYERPITMGSLFDGIGGFPLAFERCGAKAVWASEIEEFPIAVTKKHFPEEET